MFVTHVITKPLFEIHLNEKIRPTFEVHIHHQDSLRGVLQETFFV